VQTEGAFVSEAAMHAARAGSLGKLFTRNRRILRAVYNHAKFRETAKHQHYLAGFVSGENQN